MLPHFVNLFLQICKLWFGHMGTTAIGFAAGLASSVYDFWARRRREAKPVKPIWNSIGRGAKVTLAIWLSLFLWCTVEAIYRDHESLVAKIEELKRTNKDLKNATKATQDAESEEAKRKGIREQLGKFMVEADALSNGICTSPTPACIAAKNKWETKVEKYLRSNLEDQYSARFKSHMTNWGVLWNDIRGDMNILEGFIRELE